MLIAIKYTNDIERKPLPSIMSFIVNEPFEKKNKKYEPFLIFIGIQYIKKINDR
jgi:hypothetical protein